MDRERCDDLHELVKEGTDVPAVIAGIKNSKILGLDRRKRQNWLLVDKSWAKITLPVYTIPEYD